MKRKFIFFFISTFAVFFTQVYPQQVLTPEDAVRIALQNNYSIKIAKNSKDISDNNSTIGNAGFLPSLDASGSASKSVNNIRQEYSNGGSVDKTGAGSRNYNAGITLSWTVFDGLKMFASLEQLKEIKKAGEVNYKLAVEQNISDVLTTYYDVVRQEQVLAVIKRTVAISEERLKITEAEKEVGAASRFDLLRAQVDLNQDKSALMNQELTLQQSKTKLNRLLGRNVDTGFDVVDTIAVRHDLAYDDLLSDAMRKNSELLLAQQNKNIADAQLSLERGDLLPKISLNLGYNFSRSESDAGFFKSSRTMGLTYGVSASLNLFNGLNTRRRIENAQVSIESNEFAYKQTEDLIKASLLNAYHKYSNSLQRVKLETDNYKATEENVSIALEQLKAGSITPLDFRVVQQNLMDAKSRLLSAEYDAKSSETDLLRISGLLLRASD